jgi:hypothetical protein
MYCLSRYLAAESHGRRAKTVQAAIQHKPQPKTPGKRLATMDTPPPKPVTKKNTGETRSQIKHLKKKLMMQAHCKNREKIL